MLLFENMLLKIQNIITKEIGFYFKALLLLFFIAGTLGFLLGQASPETAGEAVAEFVEEFGFLDELSPLEIFGLIFLNNTLKSFTALLLGIFFGIFPVLFVLINGYAIGTILSVIVAGSGIGLVLLGTVPHGILEIPAVILAASYGVLLGEKFSKKLSGKGVFRPHWQKALRQFGRVIIPLLALAAFIETFVTDMILGAFF